jgi:hypothetical protein
VGTNCQGHRIGHHVRGGASMPCMGAVAVTARSVRGRSGGKDWQVRAGLRCASSIRVWYQDYGVDAGVEGPGVGSGCRSRELVQDTDGRPTFGGGLVRACTINV